ncbi:protein-export membrane protein SecD [candidate division WWE3 bacterium RIFOXYC1_FULL_39_7]|uniref:Protein translocase subunit SecD n=2 Tax=Katanobacteria TaxID=422282 RepID=A0A1F4X7C4_UNCKA|nr:MAG: protein-export membrane protein SecD [candidate division WWE3 bacterium RIFOXYC1_FULL_39_7]OGC77451.1 MAG: protein-export membrane protein SecD [candidate division WWE3 bacterium RIFOXYD1_FULL_39_9]
MWWKNLYFRLGLISSITTLAVLIVLPRIPIKIDSKIFKLDTAVGGYNFSLFNGKVNLDLREIKKGLDLNGGIKIVLKADVSKIESAERDNALESAKQVISRRVNLLGVTEPSISTVKAGDDYRIVVEIPGLDNVKEAVDLIGQTAQINFKKLKADKQWSEDKYYDFLIDPTAWEDTGITGADLKGVDVVVGEQGDIQSAGQPQIRLRFTDEGREKFSQVAKENINKPIGLFLDEDLAPLSMPVVNESLATGLTDDPVISGNFDFDTANNLSIQIRAGALPIPVEILEQETIGATLGNESISKSFYAGFVGLVLVFIFMLVKYGKFGLLAGFALGIYSAIVLALFKVIGVVLTLPGIAGFILSIGMATDANILIFERIKEEIFWGKPRNLAIKLGFERAWNSIKDSNISSLITSFILFKFGDGPVRGFALTLAIGILVSLFSSIFVVKTFIESFDVGKDKHGNN